MHLEPDTAGCFDGCRRGSGHEYTLDTRPLNPRESAGPLFSRDVGVAVHPGPIRGCGTPITSRDPAQYPGRAYRRTNQLNEVPSLHMIPQ